MRRLVVVVLLLVLGAGAAYGVGGALRLSWTPAGVMAEPSGVAPAKAAVAGPIGTVTVSRHTRRVDLAASTVPRNGRNVLKVQFGDDPGENYRLDRTSDGYTLSAAGEAGAAAGLYAIADQIRSGEPLTTGDVSPRLSLRLTDAGSVGRSADPAAW